jgi:tetratricopeptide (TPR) repeat protein
MARYAFLVWAVPAALAVLVLVKGVLQPAGEAPRQQRVAPAIVRRLPSQGRLRAPDDEPIAAAPRAAGPRAAPAAPKKSPELKKLAADARLIRTDVSHPAAPPQRQAAARPAARAGICYPVTTIGERPSLPPAWTPVAAGDRPETIFIGSRNDAQASQPVAHPAQAELPQPAGQPVASVGQQVVLMNQKALRLAERGALYSARAELLEALRMVAQSRDARSGGTACVSALDAALTALEESNDFSSPWGARQASLPLADIIRPHKTPVLKRIDTSQLSGLAASQHYLAYAQQQLALAAGPSPIAAESFYLLGKVHAHLAGESAGAPAAHTPCAMVFHQAALAADPQHSQAANELGVLLARFGELTAARKMLLTSVRSSPTASAWHNLATVHERLGEFDLAKRARYEAELIGGKSPRQRSGQTVEWIDAAAFAAQSPPEGADALGGKTTVASAVVPATNRPQAVRR